MPFGRISFPKLVSYADALSYQISHVAGAKFALMRFSTEKVTYLEVIRVIQGTTPSAPGGPGLGYNAADVTGSSHCVWKRCRPVN